MLAIIGLGNPGEKYEHSRHNVGFDVISIIAAKLNTPIKKLKFQGTIGETIYKGEKLVLIKPQTFMNLSGDCVAEALHWYKTEPKDVMVFSDDIDLPLGAVRVRPFGGAGTHNGWRDILLKTGSDRFPRVRVGVGGKPPEWDLADWVLGNIPKEDLLLKAGDMIFLYTRSFMPEAEEITL